MDKVKEVTDVWDNYIEIERSKKSNKPNQRLKSLAVVTVLLISACVSTRKIIVSSKFIFKNNILQNLFL